jgi:hypothetical protein
LESPHGSGTAGANLTRAGQLVGYKVYRSNQPNTTPTAGNLLTSVAPSQTSAPVSVASGGTFFVVTAVYDDGESGPSNEASGDIPGPTVDRVKASRAKITATGQGFQTPLEVFVDGIPFASEPRVKKQGAKAVQSGALLTGQSIGEYLTNGRTATVAFRNPDGGITRKVIP